MASEDKNSLIDNGKKSSLCKENVASSIAPQEKIELIINEAIYKEKEKAEDIISIRKELSSLVSNNADEVIIPIVAPSELEIQEPIRNDTDLNQNEANIASPNVEDEINDDYFSHYASMEVLRSSLESILGFEKVRKICEIVAQEDEKLEGHFESEIYESKLKGIITQEEVKSHLILFLALQRIENYCNSNILK